MAQTKPDKSEIISGVVSRVRQGGRFVKRCPDTGNWILAEDLLCREKCSQCFRDALHQTYRSSNVSKKNKRRRELERQFQQQDAVMCPPEAKRMRSDPVPVPVPPMSTPLTLFDWDMSPIASKPRVFRRASDLNGNMVSLLVDAFGTGVNETENVDENPFEPTPFPLLPVQDNDNFWERSTAKTDSAMSFGARPRFDSFPQDEVFEDFSFKSDIMDMSFTFQPQQNQVSDNATRGPNIAAAFAA